MNDKSAWIFIGNLSQCLTEGDIITVFSQYGEVMNINLARSRETGKPRGFCFLCYRDRASTTLAVDNFNGIRLLGRTLKVKHADEYKVPKYKETTDEEIKRLLEEGCAPKPIQRARGEVHRADTRNMQNSGNKHQKTSRKKAKHADEKLVPFRRIDAVDAVRESRIHPKDNWRNKEIWREIRKREKEKGKDMKKMLHVGQDDFFVPNRYK